VTIGTSARTAGRAGGSTPTLSLSPLRAVRYDAARVSDLAAVLAQPCDVTDPDSAHVVADADPHSVLRLILPGARGQAAAARYRHAAATFTEWLRLGVLAADPEPALYVYERDDGGSAQRGLIGGLGLCEPDAGVVLPHEDVLPGLVEDRLRLVSALRANLEPILLGYRGGPAAAQVIEAVAAEEPVQSARLGGVTHRLWSTSDPERLAAVSAELAPRQALIADGHHRYATYLRLRERYRAAGFGPGPWDQALALLIDSSRHPLWVRAIHRVLPELPLRTALDRARQVFRVRPVRLDPDEALARLGPNAGAFLLAGEDGLWQVDRPAADAVARWVRTDRPELWRRLDATILHEVLFAVWGVRDEDRFVRYHHEPASAVSAARRSGGVAVLLAPADAGSVAKLAAAGVRMPRKSTSFGPKPLAGLVLRSFAVG
jgi:uncharacterized protein (DUF1015 family)